MISAILFVVRRERQHNSSGVSDISKVRRKMIGFDWNMEKTEQDSIVPAANDKKGMTK